MGYDEIEATRALLRDDTTDLEKYFKGLENIRYLYSYDHLYVKSKRDILTWVNAREYFLYNERQNLFWESHRSFSHFILLSHAVVEYLSSNLLLQYFDPKKGRTELLSAIDEIGQFNRQQMMHDLGIISGSLNDDMNRVRGVRNDFAHEVDPHFELDYKEHPISILNKVKNVTDELVNLLYKDPYNHIIRLLKEIYSGTFPEDYSTTSTAELISIYQFEIKEGGGLYDQKLPRELYERGVNPEDAPSFEEFETIDDLSDVGTGSADPFGMGVVQLRAVPFLPNDVRLEEEIPISTQIEFISDSTFHKLPGDLPTEFEWFCYLMIDDRVVDINPTDSDGFPESRCDTTDRKITVEFNYTFTEDGDHDIVIGMQILNEDFRFHLVLFEGSTKAYGPFTA